MINGVILGGELVMFEQPIILHIVNLLSRPRSRGFLQGLTGDSVSFWMT